MHKITASPITKECFEMDDFKPDIAVDKLDQSTLTEYGKEIGFVAHWHLEQIWDKIIEKLEELRQMVLKTSDPKQAKWYWKELIRLLPESWLQKRTITLNYENLYAIVHQRENHKLNEWSGKDDPSKSNFIAWVHTLPYADDLIFCQKDSD